MVLCGPHTAAVVLDTYIPQDDGSQRHVPLAGVVLRIPVVYGRRPNGCGITAILLSAIPVARRAARDVLGDADAWFVVITSPDDVLHHNTASLSAAASALRIGISTTQVRHPRASTLHLPQALSMSMPLRLKDMIIRSVVHGADVEAFKHIVTWRGGAEA
jgi:hypothetical protein